MIFTKNWVATFTLADGAFTAVSEDEWNVLPSADEILFSKIDWETVSNLTDPAKVWTRSVPEDIVGVIESFLLGKRNMNCFEIFCKNVESS